MADRLGTAVCCHRAVVDAPGQAVQPVAVGRPQRGGDPVGRPRGQVADGLHPHGGQPPGRGRAHAPQGGDGQRAQEVQLGPGGHRPDAGAEDRARGAGPGLGPLRGQLGQQLVGGHPHRAGEPLLLEDAAPDGGGDLIGGPEAADRPPHVQERLVEGEGLHQRRHLLQDGHDPGRDLAVAAVVAGQEHGVGAQLAGPGRRHGRTDAEGPGLVAGRGHHPPAARAPHHHRLAPQLGAAADLHRREEGVHVHVQETHRAVRGPPADPHGAQR